MIVISDVLNSLPIRPKKQWPFFACVTVYLLQLIPIMCHFSVCRNCKQKYVCERLILFLEMTVAKKERVLSSSSSYQKNTIVTHSIPFSFSLSFLLPSKYWVDQIQWMDWIFVRLCLYYSNLQTRSML